MVSCNDIVNVEDGKHLFQAKSIDNVGNVGVVVVVAVVVVVVVVVFILIEVAVLLKLKYLDLIPPKNVRHVRIPKCNRLQIPTLIRY